MEDPVEQAVEGTVEETVEDTIKEVKEEDNVKLAAKKLTDSDSFQANYENSDSHDGARDPMSPENIRKHEPPALHRAQGDRIVDATQAGIINQNVHGKANSIDWENVVKKEARGLDDYHFGEVQDVDQDLVMTKKGILGTEKFYLPRSKVNRFDGDKLWFEVTKDEAKAYKRG